MGQHIIIGINIGVVIKIKADFFAVLVVYCNYGLLLFVSKSCYQWILISLYSF